MSEPGGHGNEGGWMSDESDDELVERTTTDLTRLLAESIGWVWRSRAVSTPPSC